MSKKKLELIEVDGQVYICFGYDEDELLEIELDDKKGRDKDGRKRKND